MQVSEWQQIRERVFPLVRSLPSVQDHKVTYEEKAQGDFVSNVDLEAEEFLMRRLRKLFPDHMVIGEESFQALESVDGYIWIIDPLDGTYNFVNGLPFYGVSLALLKDGEPVVGMVVDRLQADVFDAVKGGGARHNGRIMRHDPARAAHAPIAISSGFVMWAMEHATAGPLRKLQQLTPKFRIMGAQALQLCYVGQGRLRANISCEAKLWDDVAGALIAQEAGVHYSNFVGDPLFPVEAGSALAAGGDIYSVAAAPGDRDAVLAALVPALENSVSPIMLA